ncbi:MAG TPA: hypothetical protein VMT63_05155 [Bacteroidales bacterium]|nr:hypothetical protein [Bacteroidales bacterium]
MKRLITITTMLILLYAVTFGEDVVAKGQTFSAMGDYTLVKNDQKVLWMGKDCQSYTIRYANSPANVRIIVCKDPGCRRYVVLSDKLCIQYVCNSNYFGVEKLDSKFEAEGYKTDYDKINRFEYFHQKVIGPGQKTEIEATSLIAAFFPLLVKPEGLPGAAI